MAHWLRPSRIVVRIDWWGKKLKRPAEIRTPSTANVNVLMKWNMVRYSEMKRLAHNQRNWRATDGKSNSH